MASDTVQNFPEDRKRLKRNSFNYRIHSYFDLTLGKRVLSRKVIIAPKVITFYNDSYEVFFDFIDEIFRSAKSGSVLIDIRGVREVKAGALLVLYSNIEIIQKNYKDKNKVLFTFCANQEVNISFGRFGFWSLTGQQKFRPEYSMASSLSICTASYESTKKGDNSQLRKVIQYTQDAIADCGLEEENALAFSAITESVSNVWQHAYDEEFYKEDKDLAHWWIIVERIGDQFYIAVYDTGVGIPLTLENKKWFRVIYFDTDGQLYEYAADAHRIKMAVEYGRSRFKVDNRGKGLSEAKDFVMSNPEGIMIIFSGLGSYTYHTDQGKEELKKLPSLFPGTLIQWNLKLESAS